MSLLSRLKKTSTIKDSDTLTDSKFFNDKDIITTQVPAINVALSGDLDGGLSPSLTVFAGPSKHFKSAFSLLLAKSYMDKYPESVMIFYDSEFGTPKSYFRSFGIDMDRVLHSPLTDIETLKFDIMKQLEGITRGEKVIILVDSIGNLASKREVDNALKENTAADLSRPKEIKSLFRMVTPYLTIKDIPMVVVAHVYMTMEMFSKPVVSGGTGIMLSADNLYILGRQQEKEGTEVIGYNFVMNVEKSRHTKEKSKIIINVTHSGGINKWSGLLEMAQETGHVIKPSNGYYSRVLNGVPEDKKWRAKATNSGDFWSVVLQDITFKEAVKKLYQVSHGSIIQEEISVDDLESDDND